MNMSAEEIGDDNYKKIDVVSLGLQHRAFCIELKIKRVSNLFFILILINCH